MKLAVIDPGEAPRSARELPAIDTAELAGDGRRRARRRRDTPRAATGWRCPPATYTPKPKIYSRAQWGADERMRDKGSLHYFEVHAGFVHHTVNANDYTRAQVPGILRSIYAYHTRSRGWSDVGYNFLVDRFGRIWEGRYGGVDRPVVGAHTLGYNDNSFAMSAIGNFELRRPSKAMLQAYGALFAWKLSLHGVNADLHQAVGDQAELPGDQRAPRRRLDGLPGQVPLRQDPADPRARRRSCRRAGAAGSWSRTSRAPTTPTSSCGARATAWRSCSRSDLPGRRTRSGSRSGPGSA